jgi:pheromone shutdown protein TraB
MLDSSNHAKNELDTSSTTNNNDNNNNNNMTFWQKVRLVQQQSQGMTRAGALGTVLLTSVQQDYAESLGVELGSEFQRAHEYCLHNHVPRSTICILGDRPLQITLLRAWESLRWWGKTRVVLGLVWNLLKRQDAQELREWMQTILVQEGETDVLTTSIQELKRHFPTLERVILQERDAYMACKIYQSCRALPRRENHTMVAIVGAGHVRGMVRWLTVPSNQTPEEILSPLVTTRTGSFDEVQTLITDVTQLTIRHE